MGIRVVRPANQEGVSIGERIALHRRRRGMSQAKLAGLLGRSEQWLSNIERGERPADRYSLLLQLADVLRVPVSTLTGEAVRSPRPDRGPADLGASVRLMLSSHGFLPTLLGPGNGERPGVRQLQGLATRVEEAWEMAQNARFSALAGVLPALISECETTARRCSPGMRRVAFGLIARLYQAAAATLSVLGETDAAWVAADRSASAAESAGDELLAAAASVRLGHAFLDGGRVAEAEHTARVAIDALEIPAATGDRDALTLRGALHTVVAIAAARRGDRAAALAALDRAGELVRLLGAHRDVRFGTEFGAANVAVHRVAVAVELGDAAEAVQLVEEVNGRELSPERRARLLMDIARAHAQRRQDAEAVTALELAEDLAPELVQYYWASRDTVRDLLRRQRKEPKPALRALAERMHLA